METVILTVLFMLMQVTGRSRIWESKSNRIAAYGVTADKIHNVCKLIV